MNVKFITLGCKTNFYESQAMAELFREAGYDIAESGTADIYVINTCTVTGTGAQKSRQHIRKARKENPNAVIAVTGCYAQTEPKAVEALGEADVIVGNSGRRDIVALCERALNGERISDCVNIMKEREFEEIALTPSQSRIRANIKIEDGCSNFCTYCIIPYARGPVRSRSMEKIEEEARLLAAHGYAEIVLTGIHIGSYGKDLNNGLSLTDVIETVCGVEGIKRVRLGSVEPMTITEEFVSRTRNLKNLCPQFHLSLQSGCDETLGRMRRHYTAAEYREAVRRLREAFPDASITTDLMVGFPGETDEEFEASYSFCREIGFMHMHVFKYSVRSGTVAAKMENQVSEEVKEARSERMLALSEKMKKEFYDRFAGRRTEVLVEKRTRSGKFHATTANYMDVYIDADESMEGKIVTAVI